MTIAIMPLAQENRPMAHLVRYHGNLYMLEQRMQIDYINEYNERVLIEISWDPQQRQAVLSDTFRDLTTVITLPGEPITLRKLLQYYRMTMAQIVVDGVQLMNPRGYHLVLDGPLESMEAVYQLEISANEGYNEMHMQG
jgi:hypothetical protein